MAGTMAVEGWGELPWFVMNIAAAGWKGMDQAHSERSK